MGKSSINVWVRRRARRALMQAVYAWQMTDGDLADIFGIDLKTDSSP